MFALVLNEVVLILVLDFGYSILLMLIEYEYEYEYEYCQRLSTSTKNQGFSIVIESNVLAISERCQIFSVMRRRIDKYQRQS